ncbi:MAG: flagellar hook-associated protein 3 FlgL [Actinomycetota bacterium]|nr:flagellar hook-associated protein 3 FlgL [Actinomycetota bacterium]
MAVSRITQRILTDTALRGLQTSLSRVQDLQEELSSGRRISRPSDDPSGTASAMVFRSQRSANVQYLRNIDGASSRLAVIDSTLSQLSERLRSVQALMVQSRNGGLGQASQDALAMETDAIKDSLVDTYNTRYLDRPIFGGTIAGSAAVDGATNTYLGNDEPITARISRDAVVRVDLPGTAVGADLVPDLLDRISAAMRSGGVTGNEFDDMEVVFASVMASIGDVGARAARINITRASVDSQRLDLTSWISEYEDVDLPETIMNLQAQQVAYQAALGAAAKVTQTSLADFLQ